MKLLEHIKEAAEGHRARLPQEVATGWGGTVGWVAGLRVEHHPKS